MSDFSQSPWQVLADSLEAGYVGLHIEQGVPLLDRDLNLLQDLIVAAVRSLAGRYIGDGVASGSDAFRIEAVSTAQDLRIAAGPGGGRGWCLVGGLDVPIDEPARYSAQPHEFELPALTTPAAPQPNPRIDVVYLDAWLEEIDGTPDLDNSADVGMQTSTRLRVRWAVRVAEGVPVPAATGGRVHYPLAVLRRPHGTDVIEAGMIEDRRQRRLTVADLERRLDVVERVLLVPAFVPFAPPPATQQFTPFRGPAETTRINVNGVNLDVGRLEVLVGGALAGLVGDPSPDRVVAVVPHGLTPDGKANAVKITLRNEGGGSTSDLDFVVDPRLSFGDRGAQFRPTRGPAGTDVVITGWDLNMAGSLTVFFGDVETRPVAPPTNTTARVTVPDGVPPGNVKLKLTLGTETRTSDDSFQVEPVPAPAFVGSGAQFTPGEGQAGDRVTLNGQNFQFRPEVRFGDTIAPTIVEVTATQIVVLVPPGLVPAGSAERRLPIVVTTRGGGRATTTAQFTVRR